MFYVKFMFFKIFPSFLKNFFVSAYLFFNLSIYVSFNFIHFALSKIALIFVFLFYVYYLRILKISFFPLFPMLLVFFYSFKITFSFCLVPKPFLFFLCLSHIIFIFLFLLYSNLHTSCLFNSITFLPWLCIYIM